MVKAYLLGERSISMEISEESFTEILCSKALLGEAYAFHNRCLDICIAAADLEKRMAEVVFDYNYGLSREWSEGVSLNRISIAFISLLNLITSYHDQAKRICGDFGDVSIDHASEIKPIYSSQYDGHFEYRLVEKLRNIVQHGHREIVEVWFNVSRSDLDNILQTRTVRLKVRRENLLSHRSHLKSRLATEVDQAEWDSVDLKWCFRRYIELLVMCHKDVLSLIWPRLLHANKRREELASKMQAMSGKKNGLCLFEGLGIQEFGPVFDIGEARWFIDRISIDDLRIPAPNVSFSSQSQFDHKEYSAPFLKA
ncbi:MAG: hypothetical protein N4A39_14270 [Roseicyclus sp.]|jgi:hypothetical protein|nr:hypothetical protein [Roseicyclus sp.]